MSRERWSWSKLSCSTHNLPMLATEVISYCKSLFLFFQNVSIFSIIHWFHHSLSYTASVLVFTASLLCYLCPSSSSTPQPHTSSWSLYVYLLLNIITPTILSPACLLQHPVSNYLTCPMPTSTLQSSSPLFRQPVTQLTFHCLLDSLLSDVLCIL